MAFSEYSDFYDLYYADKDYAAEVDFVLELASRFGNSPKDVLDMGCGTGRHLAEFVKRGLKSHGFDLSERMLEHAKRRLSGSDVNLWQGNLTDFENKRQYDLVTAMFAVMGYLVENDLLLAGLRTARKHLNKRGVLVFDGWFGPAVLAQQPEERLHEYQEGEKTITRKATPFPDPVRQIVTVLYEVSVKKSGETIHQINEDHHMRFMFVQEMALAMEMTGLELVHVCPFMDPDGELTNGNWNISFVARRKA